MNNVCKEKQPINMQCQILIEKSKIIQIRDFLLSLKYLLLVQMLR